MADGNGTKSEKQPSQHERVPAPALVHIANTWLDDLTARTRSRPIPWEGYARADLVSADELRLIKHVERQPRAKVDAVYDADGPAYAWLYLRLLAKLSRTDTLQQILVLVADMLRDHDDRARLFANAHGEHAESGFDGVGLPYGPFLKLLQVQDDFVQLKAAQYLTLLIVSSPKPINDNDSTTAANILDTLLDFLTALINTGASPSASSAAIGTDYADGNGADIAIQLLEALLRSQTYRARVWDDELRRQGALVDTTPADDAQAQAQAQRQQQQQQQQQQGSKTVRPSALKGLVAILAQSQLAAATYGGGGASAAGSGAVTPSTKPGSSSASSSSTAAAYQAGGGGASSSSSSSLLNTGAAAQSGGAGGVGVGVAPNLSAAQAQYQVILCFWLLSFDAQIAAELNVKFGIVPLLADIARRAVKEKVIRIVFSTFKNLLTQAPDANAPALIGSRVLPLSETLAARKWSDEDIEVDLKAVQEVLSERLKWMSTYDEYVSELLSGELTWDNPAHELDDFWKKNADKLVENDAAHLRLLVGIVERAAAAVGGSGDGVALADSTNTQASRTGGGAGAAAEVETHAPRGRTTKEDVTSVAIALHDVRKFVQFCEAGKRRLEELGAKVKIMTLLSHPDAEVKYQALHTVGVLLSASWRTSHVSSGSGSGKADKA